jgi:hypothetical protein
MSRYLNVIAERKLSISFSKYSVHVIDPTSKMSYIEYYTTPTANAHLAKVHDSAEIALQIALEHCMHNITNEAGLLMSRPYQIPEGV